VRAHLRSRVAALALLWGVGPSSACDDPTVVVGKLPASAADSGSRSAPESEDRADTGASAVDAGAVAQPASAAPAAPSGGAPGAQLDDARYHVSIEAGSRDALCAGRGVPLTGTRANGTGADCAWRAERQLFAYGICACEELRLTGPAFELDSFDSSAGVYRPGETGSAAGVNGVLTQLADDTRLLGSLMLSGREALAVRAQRLLVAGDMKTNAALRVSSGNLRVGRDLRSSGEIVASPGSLQVGRDMYLPSAASGVDAASVSGRVIETGDVRVAAPCACGADTKLDIAALIAQAANANDNALAGFAPDALALPMYVTDLKPLPCGRLYVTRVELPGLSTHVMLVPGRSALFVQGDLHIGSVATLAITPAATGELDVFVGGDLIVEANSTLSLGDSAWPAAVRMYVAGEIRAQGAIVLAGQLYAPEASVAFPAPDGELWGSIFARKVQIASKRMHYDRAILRAGPTCSAAAPQRCDGCDQCPQDLACVAGRCGACTRDADCCEPASCTDGRCQLLTSTWP